MNKKKILFGGLILGLIGCLVLFHFYQKIYANNVTKSAFVYIKTNSSMNELNDQLSEFLDESESFLWTAAQKKFTKPKAGKYRIEKGMSNNDLVNLLRSGNQTPVKVTFNNQDTFEKLAGRVAEQIEADSLAILNAITDKNYLLSKGISKEKMFENFIPNTYEFYWNTSGIQFRDRMVKESNLFWNKSRLAKAKALNLTRSEVMTLASIVQKETAKPVERPRVAGLYLNRLKKGWPLQADPTIIFALKQEKGQDYVVKRVLYKDLKIKSPYNTYLNRGLPPSTIAMPDVSSIDGVLNAERHNYMFMCVNVEKFGYHAFAETKAQHRRNAAKYQRWLNQQGILR